MTDWHQVASCDQIAVGKYKLINANELEIAVLNHNGKFYAFENRCPHRHLPIADGIAKDGDIVCPFHGAVFCLATGKLKSAPAESDLSVFPIKIEDNTIYVQVADAKDHP